MSGPSLRKVGQGVLKLFIGNSFDTFDPGDLDLWPSDLKINRVPLRSWVIDQERKGYRRINRQTDRPTCAKQYALSFSKGGIIKIMICLLVEVIQMHAH